MNVPEISDWTGEALDAALSHRGGELWCSLWGIEACLVREIVSMPDEPSDNPEIVWTYMATLWPNEQEELFPEAAPTAAALLANARRACRPYAPPAAWDAYQLHAAQASGLQPRLAL